MRRFPAALVAVAILGVGACADLSDGGGGGGGGSAASCTTVCDRFAECQGGPVDPGCPHDCEGALQDGAVTQACLDCWAGGSCGVIDGSDPACDAACYGGGSGPYCETDVDCDSQAGEICDYAYGVCEIPCASDADCIDQLCCPEGDVPGCQDECGGGQGGAGGHGGGGDPCGPGEGLSSVDGLCHPVCADQADCYSFSAYCASDGRCYSVDLFATCPGVSGLSGPDAGGPLIFDPGQDTIGTAGNLCSKDAATCVNNGNVCQFSFQFYDPDGDVAATHTDLYSKIRAVGSDGTLRDAYDVGEATGSTLTFLGCFDETLSTIVTAVVLLDDAGHRSNPLCFEGSAP